MLSFDKSTKVALYCFTVTVAAHVSCTANLEEIARDKRLETNLT